MATNTRNSSAGSKANIEPSYQYDPWDADAGRYSSRLDNSQNHTGASDNQSYTSDRADRQNSAVQNLRNAENKALSQKEASYPDKSRDNGGSLYTGSGRPKGQGSSKKKGKGKGFLRGKGPLVTIIAGLISFGVFLSSSQSLLAPAMSTLFTSKTQTNYSSYTLRSRYITKYMMQHNSGGAVTTGFTGRVKYARIPSRLKTRLARFNIEVEGSGSNTRMTWTHTTSTGGTEVIRNIDADSFVDLYNNNAAFREDYTNARYGRAATFYDKVADKVYKFFGISRNAQKNYVATGNAEADAENYNKTISKKFEGNDSELSSKSLQKWTTTEDDGNGGTKQVEHTNITGGSDTASTSSNNTEAEATSKATSMIGTIAGKVGMIGSGVCTVLKVGSMIGIAASAMEAYQSIQFAMAQMETISKMKAGYGDESGINTLLNYLTTSRTTDVQDYNPSNFNLSLFSDVSSTGKNWNDNTSQEAVMTTEEGAPVEASGFQNLLSDAPINKDSARNYSLERILTSMGGNVVFGIGTATMCAGVSIATNLVSLAITLSPAGLVSLAGSFLTTLFTNALVSFSASAFFAFLVPTLAKVFFRNVIDTAVGIPGGQFLSQGIARANMSSAQRGSAQTPSSGSVITAFNHTNNEVLAMEAEQERNRLSPFDTSSPHTFFGSITYSLLPTVTSTNITGLASFLRSTSTSLATLAGRVSADGEGSSYITTFGNCPMLNEIGSEGDIYCNPIVTTDMSMINLSPEDSTYNDVLTSAGMDNTIKNLTCDSDGNCTVNDKSNLAKFISYCDNRESPFGAIDQNILTDLGVHNTIAESVPILGDLIDIVNESGNLVGDNMLWANGTRCGNTEKNSEFWEKEGKYYQVYINDQRILENMGAYEGSTNPVLAYEEAYAAEHPIDDSYIGYLSRISGLTLENTESVLAVVAYYTYLNNYDPSVRIAIEDLVTNLTTEETLAKLKAERLIFEGNELVESPLETNVSDRQYVIYNDIRNRSFAV